MIDICPVKFNLKRHIFLSWQKNNEQLIPFVKFADEGQAIFNVDDMHSVNIENVHMMPKDVKDFVMLNYDIIISLWNNDINMAEAYDRLIPLEK